MNDIILFQYHFGIIRHVELQQLARRRLIAVSILIPPLQFLVATIYSIRDVSLYLNP